MMVSPGRDVWADSVCIIKLWHNTYPSCSVGMGNLLRVLNDKGHVPKVNLFVDFESKLDI